MLDYRSEALGRATGLGGEAGAEASAARVLHEEELLAVGEGSTVAAGHEQPLLVAFEEGYHFYVSARSIN